MIISTSTQATTSRLLYPEQMASLWAEQEASCQKKTIEYGKMITVHLKKSLQTLSVKQSSKSVVPFSMQARKACPQQCNHYLTWGQEVLLVLSKTGSKLIKIMLRKC